MISLYLASLQLNLCASSHWSTTRLTHKSVICNSWCGQVVKCYINKYNALSLPLFIQFYIKGPSGQFTELLQGTIEYFGETDLTQYYVKSYTIVDSYTAPSMKNGQVGVRVQVTLGRRLLNHLLTTFLPTTCICLVAFSTNFFNVGRHRFISNSMMCTSFSFAAVPFWGLCGGKLDNAAGAHSTLHQRLWFAAQDSLCQDDGYMAHIQPPHPVCWGYSPDHHGHVQGRYQACGGQTLSQTEVI